MYYVTVYILEDWLGLQTSAGSMNFLIFTFLASLCAFSFCVCAFTDTVGVPPSNVPDVEEDQISDQNSKKNVSIFLTRVKKFMLVKIII